MPENNQSVPPKNISALYIKLHFYAETFSL